MKFRQYLTAAAIAAMPLAAHAATLVIPAAGTGPGANNSQWQSELTLHTAAPRPITLSLTFHQGTSVAGPVEITLATRQTLSIEDVVRTKFGVTSGAGALVINVADRDAKTLAITSRTSNRSAGTEFGQDIPAVDAASASSASEVNALNGPSNAQGSRFNFGVYAVDASTVRWEVVRANGTIAATKEASYAAGQHTQYNSGIESLLGSTAQNNDVVQARVLTGRAIFYGSVVNPTGDPSFVPGIRTQDIAINFAGVDLDENGTVDVADANGDGVLDAPIDVFSSLFPNYFRVIATGEFGEAVEYEIVSSPTETALLDSEGTVRVAAAGDVKGTTGEIRIRVKSGASSSIFTIPVRIR
ncbi:MAG: hypothetical protein M3Q69_11905 [Acidobacteriota bacterium]|nr:hypothetical protein [Acidobacteriota bacterium]